MSPRHLVSVVVTVALSSIAAATACGVDVSIDDGGSSGTSGTSGASGTSGTGGTSGATGTSGTSGTGGTSGASGTSGGDGATEEVVELAITRGMNAFAVGSGVIALATSTSGLRVCAAPDCPASIGASNPPAGAATAVAYHGGKFYAIIGDQLRRCTPSTAPANLDCADSVKIEARLTGGKWLRVDSQSAVWLSGGELHWTSVATTAGPQSIIVVSLGGIALTADRLVYSAQAPGRLVKLEQVAATASTGTAAGDLVLASGDLVEPNAIALDPNELFAVVRGSSTTPDGYVLRCGAAGNGCIGGSTRPIQSLAQPQGLAVDATSLFVSETGANRVRRAPRVGGPATTIASTIPKPMEIVVDDTYAWVVGYPGGDTTLYRVKKQP
ncbi:MAG: hypothetical protein JST00_13310 [Deltaproteobacteria bacterium]|nr:hypothetical protein [Deltaproteobacteria bacterium]